MTPCSMSRNSQSKPATAIASGDLDAAGHPMPTPSANVPVRASRGRHCERHSSAAPLYRCAVRVPVLVDRGRAGRGSILPQPDQPPPAASCGVSASAAASLLGSERGEYAIAFGGDLAQMRDDAAGAGGISRRRSRFPSARSSESIRRRPPPRSGRGCLLERSRRMKVELVCRLALVMSPAVPDGRPPAQPSPSTLAFAVEFGAIDLLAGKEGRSPGSSISTFCSICRTMTSMCLSLIRTPCSW